MNILVIGGTKFLGRAVVEEALNKGHFVSVFNRGNHPDVFVDSRVETIIGDRNEDLSLLKHREWDAVIDTCAFFPNQVSRLTQLLKHQIRHYTLISSISVYQDWIPEGIDQNYTTPILSEDKMQELLQAKDIELPGPYYGPLKRMCEMEAELNLPSRVLTIRAGLLVGAYDYSDRLTYWVRRIHRGGEVLAAENPQQHVQFIDVRDVAAWILYCAERQITGIYNTTGPEEPLTFKGLLDTCKVVTHSDASYIWAKEKFLLDNGVAPWSELPLWLPQKFPLEEGGEPWRGVGSVNCSKAFAAGLQCRPIADTLRDLWQWDQAREQGALLAGLNEEREQELIAAYKQMA